MKPTIQGRALGCILPVFPPTIWLIACGVSPACAKAVDNASYVWGLPKSLNTSFTTAGDTCCPTWPAGRGFLPGLPPLAGGPADGAAGATGAGPSYSDITSLIIFLNSDFFMLHYVIFN